MTKIQDFVIIFQKIKIINTFVKFLNNRIIDQLKIKLAIINIKKRQIYLRYLLTQIEIEREIDFFVVSMKEIKTKRIRNDFELQTLLSLKKNQNFKFRTIISKTFKNSSINIFENVLIYLILNLTFIKSIKQKFCLHRIIYFIQFLVIDTNIEKTSISMRIFITIMCRFYRKISNYCILKLQKLI